MIKPWEREDTREWISLLEHRLSDMKYYKNQAIEWCERRGISDSAIKTKCLITACIWVSHMRYEPLSFGEIYDLIGVTDLDDAPLDENPVNFDDILDFKDGIGDNELEVVLQALVNEESSS